jgi:hypothetical protein
MRQTASNRNGAWPAAEWQFSCICHSDPMLLEERLRLAGALGLVLGALVLLAHAAAAQGMEPPAVVEVFTRARADRDLEVAMAQIADNAVMRVERARPRVLNGKQEIRQFFETFSAEPPAPLVPAHPLADDTVTWSERVVELRTGSLELTGQALVQNGKIVSIVYRTGREVAADESSAGPARPLPAASMMVGGVGLFGVGLLSLATVRSRRASDSHLTGRMLAGLRQRRGLSHTLR